MFSILQEKMHLRMFNALHSIRDYAERYREILCPLLGTIFGDAVECTSVKVICSTYRALLDEY
jgi:hypothetical protein